MTATVQRFLYAGVLMIWGVLLGYFYYSGRVKDYLHPSFHIWMVASAFALMIMAVGLLLLPQAADACPEGECLHTPGSKTVVGSILTSLVLIVPLLIAAKVSPSQFGAALVANRGLTTDISGIPGYKPFVEPPLPTEDGSQPAQTDQQGQPISDYLPKTESGLIKAQTVDLLYASQEPTMREDFENKEVEMIGQFMPAQANNAKGDRFNLVRMFVNCCASDARPVAVTIQGARPEKLVDMSWIRIKGKATFPIEGGNRIPVVVATSVEPTDPPEESFIY